MAGKENDFDNPLKWWNKAKLHFKIVPIQRSTQLRKQRRHACKQLEDKLQRLQTKIRDVNNSVSAAYQQTKSELQQHHLGELAAIAARTKIQYTLEGEKSTRYFYTLENQQKANQTI